MSEKKENINLYPFIKISLMVSKFENDNFINQFQYQEYNLDEIFYSSSELDFINNKFKKFIINETDLKEYGKLDFRKL